jgi:5-methylthioribose kinase
MDQVNLEHRFHESFPGKFFLDYSVRKVNDYLSAKNFLTAGEHVTQLEKPGDGNMNLVIRVRTGKRSFIMKQARPWVEKYPHIPAPVERNHVEAEFYMAISTDKTLRLYSPEIIGYDPENFIAIYNDLGPSADFSYLYESGNRLINGEKNDLLTYLSALHQLNCRDFPYNGAMRKLNHDYIFMIPFMEENGLDLDTIQTGLKKASRPYTINHRLKKKLAQLGKVYLEEGPVLIHGDYFPGSWLRSASGIRIIDPEFGFKGFAEFDVGVMIAHLVLARQTPELVNEVLDEYDRPVGFDEGLLAGYTGTEILRRLIGVAQLPLKMDLKEKDRLMQLAEQWIMSSKLEGL